MADTGAESTPRKLGIALRIALPFLIIFLGLAAMAGIKALKKAPSTSTRQPVIRSVKTVSAERGRYQVKLYGYGTIRSNRTLQIAPEISGRIKTISATLEDGNTVKAGDQLLTLDRMDYDLSLAELRAEQNRLLAELELLRKTKADNEELLSTRLKSRDLNKTELTRLKRLRDTNNSVSQSTVDAAELRLISADEAVLRIKQELARIPVRIKALESMAVRVKAQIDQAELAISRCTLTAPISGRLHQVHAEAGQVVTRGQVILAIIDDTQLEIEAAFPLESVMKWLPLEQDATSNWLTPTATVTADVIWVDGDQRHTGNATLNRISYVDESTRTVNAVFNLKNSPKSPLIAGMFCRVTVMGSWIEDAIRIPRRAVTTDNQVGVIEDGVFRTKTLSVLCLQKESVLVQVPESDQSMMLQPKDKVIVSPSTTLVDGQPLQSSAE